MNKAFEEWSAKYWKGVNRQNQGFIDGITQDAWNAAMLHAAEVAEAGAPLNPTEIAAKLRQEVEE